MSVVLETVAAPVAAGAGAPAPYPQRARVVFDEAHSEAWTIRPRLAAAMQPSHPRDCSYVLAAEALAASDFEVWANVDGPMTAERLHEVDVLVVAHPSDPAWERTTGVGSPRFSGAELAAIEAFVAAGGGLVVLGETENEKYGNNLDELLAPYGLRLENATVQDYGHHHAGAPSWIMGELGGGGAGADPGAGGGAGAAGGPGADRGAAGDLLARVHAVCLYRATTIVPRLGVSVPIRAAASSTHPGAALMAAVEHGRGRVVVLADSDLFGDDCLDEFDHRELWRSVVYWAGAGAFAPERERGAARDDPAVPEDPAALRGPDAAREHADPASDPAWLQLREACDALALMQAEDGSLDPAAPPEARTAATGQVRSMIAAIAGLAPRFPHQARYLEAVRDDLDAWVRSGFARPDFTRALGELRPELTRHDGTQHLVVMPMYKQNASRATCFEALIIRVPWPSWAAELERERYENAKFVPVELVAHTRGYESECAVLFPEMVSTRERPVNNFGAIFCDREAARFRRVAGEAAELLALNLPPDAACLLASPALSRDAFILWDLIHDRNHSHGELPFDPFMIRQRAPYWMYALEELRCDLIAFGEAVRLEHEGLALGRHVQYAILLDRLLRFPITGARVRNYDGLGGQLLFAHLHRGGHLEWRNNRLTVHWPTVGEGVAALRAQILDLYRAGIDRSKVAHWRAAHELVAASVPAAAGSRVGSGAPSGANGDTEDPRAYLDLVLEDEFPLSIFYGALKAKLAAEP